MLKLERRSLTREVVLRLRPKEPFLSRYFMRAFILAFGIHLFSLIAFRVESAPREVNPATRSAVAVELQAGAREGQGLSVVQNGGEVPSYLSQMGFGTPELPDLPPSAVSHRFDPPKETSLSSKAFQKIEERPYLLEKESCLSFLGTRSPLKVRIGGQLAECRLQDDGLKAISLPKGLKGPCTCRYHVQMDHRTGEIFSLVKAKPIDSTEMEAVALQVVRAMRFDPISRGLATRGEVEISLE